MNKKPSSHGGNIYKASKEFRHRKEDILDYSANINPLGVPEDFKDILISGIESVSHYPDPDCTDLKAEISRYLNVDEDNIIVGNGASEIIFLLFDVLRPKKLFIPAPTFSEYAKAAMVCEALVEYFELKEDNRFNPDINLLISTLPEDTNTLLLCNPNNPTSTLIEKKDLQRLIEYCCERNINIIIDEAFIELTLGANDNSVVNLTKEFGNLFIIRAFTKLFAIPGLRLGYGIGNPDIVGKMWDKKTPWSVNSFACQTGRLMRDESGYLKRTSKWLSEELEWFYNKLACFTEFMAFKPSTNFILMKILNTSWNSSIIRHRMASKGILIRDAENFMFLDDRFIRIAIKDREANIRFLNTLDEVLAELKTGMNK